MTTDHMSDDLRERVARAIFVSKLPPNMCASDWDSGAVLGADNAYRNELYKMADAALAEIGTVRENALREAAEFADPEKFDTLDEKAAVSYVRGCILAATEPAPVSVREAARIVADHIYTREDAVRAYRDDVFLSIADHGMTASHIRAIAEGKDDE